MDKLLKEIAKVKAETECDLVKIFYENNDTYTIKFIRGQEVVRKVKKGKQQFKDNNTYKLTYYDDENDIYIHKVFTSESKAIAYVVKNKIYQYNLNGEFHVNTGYDY